MPFKETNKFCQILQTNFFSKLQKNTKKSTVKLRFLAIICKVKFWSIKGFDDKLLVDYKERHFGTSKLCGNKRGDKITDGYS